MNDFYLVVIRVERTKEDGVNAKVTEQYLVKAANFTDAEVAVMAEVGDAECEILRITRPKLAEVFGAAGSGEKYYRVKVAITTLDEETGVEKKSTQAYLVGADTLERAMDEFAVEMRGTMSDWAYTSVSETKIVDYLGVEYHLDGKE